MITYMTKDKFNLWLDYLEIPKSTAAKLLGISPKTLYRYSNGEYPIPKTIALATKAVANNLHHNLHPIPFTPS